MLCSGEPHLRDRQTATVASNRQCVYNVGAHVAFDKRMPLVAAECFGLVFVPNVGWCVWLFRFYNWLWWSQWSGVFDWMTLLDQVLLVYWACSGGLVCYAAGPTHWDDQMMLCAGEPSLLNLYDIQTATVAHNRHWVYILRGHILTNECVVSGSIFDWCLFGMLGGEVWLFRLYHWLVWS
jgi:hypothetical protein